MPRIYSVIIENRSSSKQTFHMVERLDSNTDSCIEYLKSRVSYDDDCSPFDLSSYHLRALAGWVGTKLQRNRCEQPLSSNV